LKGDNSVTYGPLVTDDDVVFKALADPTRRFLLDLLFQRDGRHAPVGPGDLHFLNPVPIRVIHDRWIDKYRERGVVALLALKAELEKKDEGS
jgi:hypothetical protein